MSHNSNATTIEQELTWLENVLSQRLDMYFNPSAGTKTQSAPNIDNHDSSYADLIRKYKLTEGERLLLVLALAPHIRPATLDFLAQKNKHIDKPFTEFGGTTTKGYNGFLPTGETALFLLTGDDIEKRLSALSLLNDNHKLFRDGILEFATPSSNAPLYSRQLMISKQYLALLTNQEKQYNTPSNFLATPLTTSQDWEDVVISDHTRSNILELKQYLDHGKNLRENFQFGKYLQKGYRTLFSGPSGTGKTMVATLLGKAVNKEVYRVNLSAVVSKYIGETEKNLDKIFEQAESQDSILFFDEADALFGKRTNVQDAHDHYANQEVSYLLQRLEDFNGLIILSTNGSATIDAAFARRFQSIIIFGLPNTEERLQLWKQRITSEFNYDKNVDLEHLAHDYELTPEAITTVLQHAILQSLERGDNIIQLDDLMHGIRKEYQKTNNSITMES